MGIKLQPRNELLTFLLLLLPRHARLLIHVFNPDRPLPYIHALRHSDAVRRDTAEDPDVTGEDVVLFVYRWELFQLGSGEDRGRTVLPEDGGGRAGAGDDKD